MIKLLGDVMTGLKSRKRMKNTNFWREKLGNMKDISECGTGCCLNFEDWQIWRSQGWIDLKRWEVDRAQFSTITNDIEESCEYLNLSALAEYGHLNN